VVKILLPKMQYDPKEREEVIRQGIQQGEQKISSFLKEEALLLNLFVFSWPASLNTDKTCRQKQ
jgi:hypothetical protein